MFILFAARSVRALALHYDFEPPSATSPAIDIQNTVDVIYILAHECHFTDRLFWYISIVYICSIQIVFPHDIRAYSLNRFNQA